MRSAAVPLVVFLLPLLSLHTFTQPEPLLEAPSFTEGDSWEYRVVGRLDELPGAENLSVSLRIDGLMAARVSSVGESDTNMTWSGRLSVQGNLTLPGGGGPREITISGTVQVTYVERREMPYLLATAFQNRAVFSLNATLGQFPLPASATATAEIEATFPPSPGSPTYPLAEGEQRFNTTSRVASDLSFSIPSLGLEGQIHLDEVGSSLRIEVSPGEPMSFPFGTFPTVRLVTEVLTGLAPSPFFGILSGSKQVASYAEEVGNPLSFRFLQNDTEVGNATLLSFSTGTVVASPFWLNPIFLGGLLAIPIALLLFRYWRERRRGL